MQSNNGLVMDTTTTTTAESLTSPVPPSLRPVWMSTEEACGELGIAKETLYKKIAGGLFATERYGRRTLISRSSVRQYLNQFRHGAG
jgi:excisionase family DNA binding protein